MSNLKKHVVLLLGLATSMSASALTFGPQDRTDLGNVDDVALIVNKEAISRAQLQKEIAAVKTNIPKSINIPQDQLDSMILERVIMQHLIKQLADKAAVNLSADQIDSAIVNIAQQNGMSSVDQLYQEVQKQTGMSAQQYRRVVSEQLVQAQLKQLVVGNSVQISQSQIDSQIAQIARQRGSTIHLQDLLVPIPSGEPDERGKAYHEIMTKISESLEKNPDDLQSISTEIEGARFTDLGNVNIAQIPTRFAQAVANLSTGNMLTVPVVDTDGMHFLKVVSKTDAQGQGFYVPQANVKHILIRVNPENPEASKRFIDIIYAELQKGANFEAIAKEYSQDPVSAVRGGVLGWMSADEVDPTFAQQMINVPLNQISAPFKSSFGWHVIEVSDRRSVDRTEDRIRNQIRNSLYEDALEKAWQQKLAETRHAAYVDVRQ